jgi:riboflavin biosynthesis pyrimidine reductase
VTARGELDPSEKALQQGALILTTEGGAGRLRGRLPASCRVAVLGRDRFEIGRAVEALRAAGHGRILSEGGPHLFAQLVAADLVDTLFLTVAPVLAGRSRELNRLGLVEGAALSAAALRRLRLLSARRHAGHLFLSYALKRSGAE